MARCANCGAELAAEARFCPSCGQAVTASERRAPDDASPLAPPAGGPLGGSDPATYRSDAGDRPVDPSVPPSIPSGPVPPAPPPVVRRRSQNQAIIIGVAIGIFALVLVLLIAGIFGESATGERDYPQAVRANFVESCVRNGGEREVCTCILERFEDRYTLSEFVRIDRQVNQDNANLPPEALEDVAACAG